MRKHRYNSFAGDPASCLTYTSSELNTLKVDENRKDKEGRKKGKRRKYNIVIREEKMMKKIGKKNRDIPG
jgi:hypothetical protein